MNFWQVSRRTIWCIPTKFCASTGLTYHSGKSRSIRRLDTRSTQHSMESFEHVVISRVFCKCKTLHEVEYLALTKLYRALNVQISDRCLQTLFETAANLKSLVISFQPAFGSCIGVEIKSQHPSQSQSWTRHSPHFGNGPNVLSAFRNLVRIELLRLWGDIEP